MKFNKQDICRIGFDYIETDKGYLEILSIFDEFGIEEILLRNILLEFGNYRITEYTDYENEDNVVHGYVTNLPYSLYESAYEDFVEYYKQIDIENGIIRD
jgi:hypothetical protein